MKLTFEATVREQKGLNKRFGRITALTLAPYIGKSVQVVIREVSDKSLLIGDTKKRDLKEVKQ